MLLRTIRICPSKQKTTEMLVGVVFLCFLAFLFPGAFLITAFALPLLVCPLMGAVSNRLVMLAVTSLAPAVAAWLQTFDVSLVLAVCCAAAAPGVVTLVLMKQQANLTLRNHIHYLAAFFFGQVVILLWLSGAARPMSIYEWLAQQIAVGLRSTPAGDTLLIRLAELGQLAVPENFPKLDELYAPVDRSWMTQLYLSFETYVHDLLLVCIPIVMIRVTLAGSLLTLLRVQKHNGSTLLVEDKNKKKVVVVNPPRFSQLALPRRDIGILLMLDCLLSIPMLISSGVFAQWMTLLFEFIQNILTLAGTASLLRLMSLRRERPAVWQGILAAFVWVLFEIVPILVLVFERNITALLSQEPDKEKEEQI